MSSRFRTIVFWLHLAAGLTVGAVVLVMSVTGVLLMYEQQIIEWSNRGYRSAPPPEASPLPVEALIGRVVAEHPETTPSSFTMEADPAAPASVRLGRERTVYLNRYTGEILGEGSPGVRSFFHAVTDWHRWLAAGDDNRSVGRAVTGAANLAFLFLVVSGFYLWIPRKWSWRQVRNVTWFRRGLPGKARDFNWHNVIGLWMAVPLFLVVLSAVLISYPWANDVLFRLVGEEPPPRRGAGGPERPRGGGGAQPGREARSQEAAGVKLDGLDELWARAERQVPGWKTLSLRLPEDAGDPVTFTINQGGRGRVDLRAQLALDRQSGEVERWEPYASQSLGRKLRSWARWVHTGEAGGVLGQTLAGLASAGGAVLVWTGAALAWRRFVPKRRRRTVPEADEGLSEDSFSIHQGESHSRG
ncbi:MAG TPA: PepSY-associated TM helix domain-containing protein [Thermoanaerobaculia bacterium]|nr:PepSY-associated TM helix domain-containing protein [Thermoanaerobaculia bacterium]